MIERIQDKTAERQAQIVSAFSQTLVRCAIGAGLDRAARKGNLTALYEAGAISGPVLQAAIAVHQLGDA